MSRLSNILPVICTLLVTQAITSCIHQQSPELRAAHRELRELQQKEAELTSYLPGSYDHFVSHNGYPATINIYRNEELMAKANKKSRIIICLEQQRGRMYVDGQVAADWPVSTGVPGHETPPGRYSVLEKKEQYASNRYGKMYNAEGKCINSDADIFTQQVPEGGRFDGSPMPYWMRLTWDGVGMHIGKVKAGSRLSHGCIRTPKVMAEALYKIVGIGTKVAVIDKIEPEFPARQALSLGVQQHALEQGIRKLQTRINTLTTQENNRHARRHSR